MIQQMRRLEEKMLTWCNLTIRHSLLDRWLAILTNLGGPIFTIASTLLISIFAPQPWKEAGWRSMAALTVSHLIVAVVKKKFMRPRPYLARPNILTGRVLLKDYSFPSGHTTAIFSIVVPFIMLSPWLALFLIPVAVTVALSRIYLGLHYPSDCLAGGLLGSATSVVVTLAW
jgi:undecaprenyl-diphosphatase